MGTYVMIIKLNNNNNNNKCVVFRRRTLNTHPRSRMQLKPIN